MAKIKTYLDSGVLIAAYQGLSNVAIPAIQILDDTNREFIASAFVKLEVLSKALYYRQESEINFYATFLNSCTTWADDLNQIIITAEEIASQFGLAALDALHVAAAISVHADELITTEKITKPMYRVTQIKITGI